MWEKKEVQTCLNNRDKSCQLGRSLTLESCILACLFDELLSWYLSSFGLFF